MRGRCHCAGAGAAGRRRCVARSASSSPLAGANPFDVYRRDVRRGASARGSPSRTRLQRAAPLMLTALCTALPARLGLMVIGGEGALALRRASRRRCRRCDARPLVIAATVDGAGGAVVGGGLWIALAGALRGARGVNETISCLLLNYIAIALFNHLVEGPLRDPASLNKPSTRPIGDGSTCSATSPAWTCTTVSSTASSPASVRLRADRARRSASPRAWWAATCARRSWRHQRGAAGHRALLLAGGSAGLAGVSRSAPCIGTANATR